MQEQKSDFLLPFKTGKAGIVAGPYSLLAGVSELSSAPAPPPAPSQGARDLDPTPPVSWGANRSSLIHEIKEDQVKWSSVRPAMR